MTPSPVARRLRARLAALVGVVVVAAGMDAGCHGGGQAGAPAVAVAGDVLDAAVVGDGWLAFPRPLGDPLLSVTKGTVVYSDCGPSPPPFAVLPFVRRVEDVWSDDSSIRIATSPATAADLAGAGVTPVGGSLSPAAAAPPKLQPQAPMPAQCTPYNGTLDYNVGQCMDPKAFDECFVKTQLHDHPCAFDFYGVAGSWGGAASPTAQELTALKAGWIRVGANLQGESLLDANGNVDTGAVATFASFIQAQHDQGIKVLANLTEGLVKTPSVCQYQGQLCAGAGGQCAHCAVNPSCGYGPQCASLPNHGLHLDQLWPTCGLSGPALQGFLGLWQAGTDAKGTLTFKPGTYFDLLEKKLAAVFGAVKPDAWEILNEPDKAGSCKQAGANVTIPQFMNAEIVGGVLAAAYKAYRATYTHRKPGDPVKSFGDPSCEPGVGDPLLVGGTLMGTQNWKMIEGGRRVAVDYLEKNPPPQGFSADMLILDAYTFHDYALNAPSQWLPGAFADMNHVGQPFPTTSGHTVQAQAPRFWITEGGWTTCTDPSESPTSPSGINGFDAQHKPLACPSGDLKQTSWLDDFLKTTWSDRAKYRIDHALLFSWADTDDGKPSTILGQWFGVVSTLGGCAHRGGGLVKKAWQQFQTEAVVAAEALTHTSTCNNKISYGVPDIRVPPPPPPSPHPLSLPLTASTPVGKLTVSIASLHWVGDPCFLHFDAQPNQDKAPTAWSMTIDGKFDAELGLTGTIDHKASDGTTVVNIPIMAPASQAFTTEPLTPAAEGLGAIKPIPVPVGENVSILCTVEGDFSGYPISFHGKVASGDLAITVNGASVTASALEASIGPGSGGSVLHMAPLPESGAPAATVKADGTIRCDLGAEIVVSTFEQPLIRLRPGVGFEIQGCQEGGGMFLRAGLPEVFAVDVVSPALKPMPVCMAPPDAGSDAGDDAGGDAGDDAGSDAGSTCTPPDPPPPAGMYGPSDCSGSINASCLQGYRWSCQDGCLVFDRNCPNKCPPEAGQPGGLYGCFAQGCYPCGCDANWKCIDACWYYSPGACPF